MLLAAILIAAVAVWFFVVYVMTKVLALAARADENAKGGRR